MKHYKLVTDELIVDAIRDEDAQWIVENRHNYSTYTGRRDLASGVLSSDGTKVWHLDGKPPFHDFPDYVTVRLVEIEPAEYEALIEELTANGAIRPQDDEPAPENDDGSERTAKLPAIKALEERMEALAAENAMLTECLLEISEIIYGE